jgi:hypothetical protein
MGTRGTKEVNGKHVNFGFDSITDWVDSAIISFPAPWKVGDNNDKYYGTEILDARGKHILSVWFSEGNPSSREKGDMSDDEWIEYCCDSHWESETALHLAAAIVAVRNLIARESRYDSGSKELPETILRSLILQPCCSWSDAVIEEIKTGGPERRMTPEEAGEAK